MFVNVKNDGDNEIWVVEEIGLFLLFTNRERRVHRITNNETLPHLLYDSMGWIRRSSSRYT
jgi:hypothetical protein